MAGTYTDTPEQAALRVQIENHPIWQYPPEERLSHQREWQELYLLVLRFKTFLGRIEKNLRRVDDQSGHKKTDFYGASAILADENELSLARYTTKAKLRTRMDTLVFTECMRKAVAKFNAGLGKPFLAYFDAIYVNAMYESANRQNNRPQGDVRLSSQEGALLKRLRDLCDKMNLDPDKIPVQYYEALAEQLQIDPKGLISLVRKSKLASSSFSLDAPGKNGDTFDLADPKEETIEDGLQRSFEAMRIFLTFAKKDYAAYPRYFFTNDVLRPLFEENPTVLPDVYCSSLERGEALLWQKIFMLPYIDYLFAPQQPRSTRAVFPLKPVHPLQDSSIAEHLGRTPAAVSVQRRKYRTMMTELLRELDNE